MDDIWKEHWDEMRAWAESAYVRASDQDSSYWMIIMQKMDSIAGNDDPGRES